MNVDNTEDLLDSRAVIERLDELASAYMAHANDGDDFSEEEAEELRILTEFADEASGYAEDWAYGETLIRDSYFKDYACELAEDCGMLGKSDQWPNYCIDWEWAACELRQDYSAVDFDGVTYWVR